MDFEAQRQQLLEHCLWMMSLDPAYAKWAASRYGKLPHLEGFEQQVLDEWKVRNPPPPAPRESRSR